MQLPPLVAMLVHESLVLRQALTLTQSDEWFNTVVRSLAWCNPRVGCSVYRAPNRHRYVRFLGKI